MSYSETSVTLVPAVFALETCGKERMSLPGEKRKTPWSLPQQLGAFAAFAEDPGQSQHQRGSS